MFDRGCSYDGMSNVTAIADDLTSQTQNFQYDHRDRLTHAYVTGSATAAYDALGNLRAKPARATSMVLLQGSNVR